MNVLMVGGGATGAGPSDNASGESIRRAGAFIMDAPLLTLPRPVAMSFVVCRFALISAVFVSSAATASAGAVDDDGRVVSFARDIVPIFREHCYECHNAENAKNDFRIDEVDSVMSYVSEGEAEDSDLYATYMLSDDDDLLMPPPSHGGPLPPGELALVRVWIDEGADWPENVDVRPPEEDEDDVIEVVDADEPARNVAERVWAAQGYLHPATVHFPIALLLVGGLFVPVSMRFPQVNRQIAMTCLFLGAASAVVATMMGWAFAPERGYGGWTKVDMDSEVFWHRWSAVILTTLSVGSAVMALFAVRRDSPRLHRAWQVGLVLCALIVGAVGHQGGEMTYGKDLYPKAFRVLTGSDG